MAGTARRVCVTGAAGKTGRTVVRALTERGYDVVATDIAPATYDVRDGVIRADLTDYGQAVQILHGTDAVVHLASIPAPGRTTPSVTFSANVTMNFNVFHAAARLGLHRVAWASSETTLGVPFGVSESPGLEAEGQAPRYAPVDENHYPVTTSAYALSKVTSETIAEQVAHWSGISLVGLRFSSIMDPADYERISLLWPDPHARKGNLWSYVDVRDVATACRLGLEADIEGSENVIIGAADTVMNRSSAGLLAEVFPGVPLNRELEKFETLLSIGRARKILGYIPRYSWRDY